jgi:transposase
MTQGAAGGGEAIEGWSAGATTAGPCGDLRRREPHRGGEDWRRRIAGGSRLGGQVQRAWFRRLIDRKARGQPPRLNDEHRSALAAILERADPAVYGLVRWRIVDLCQWIFEEFRVVVSQQTLSRVLRKKGYRKLSARPRHHAQAEGAIEDCKKVFPARLEEIGREKGVAPDAIEVWFADEARGGQKNYSRPSHRRHPSPLLARRMRIMSPPQAPMQRERKLLLPSRSRA